MRRLLSRIVTDLVVFAALVIAVEHVAAAVVITGSHYENTASVLCGNQQDCSLAMAAVPVGDNLRLTRVSCTLAFAGSATVQMSYLQLGHKDISQKGAAPYTFFQPTVLSSQPKLFLVNTDMDQMFSAGQTPFFYVHATSGPINNIQCTLFGTLTPVAGT
jgi:hypothetical protein